MNAPPPFEPTSCACGADRRNCKRQPGHLLPGQLEKIAARLGLPVREAGWRFFRNSPGMLLLKAGEVFRLRTITPAFRNGKCVFFKHGRCRIHGVAPFGCRYFDVHMSGEEADRRARWGVEQIQIHRSDYDRQRDSLPEATHWQGAPVPPTKEEATR